MGDYFQTIVDRDATPEEAEALAARIRDWLIAEGIVASEMTDCVLDGDCNGHPPGANYERAVTEPDERLLSRWTNGTHIRTGRWWFDSGQGGSEAVCSQCHDRRQFPDETWTAPVNQWFEGNGFGMATCPACGYGQPADEWTFDPPTAFGCIGFKFWNWPPHRLLHSLSRRLSPAASASSSGTGHR